MKDRLTLYTKYLLDFMFYSGIAVILTLPLSIWFQKQLLFPARCFFPVRGICRFDHPRTAENVPHGIKQRLLYPGKCKKSGKNEHLQFFHCSDHGMPAVYLYNARRFCDHSGLRDRRTVQ